MSNGLDGYSRPRATACTRWAEFFAREEYSHAVTLRPHNARYALGVEHMHRAFVRVHMLVDRALLGPRFPRKHGLRTAAVGIVEGLPDATHLHGAMRVRQDHWAKFESLFSNASKVENVWNKVSPAGTCVVERIGDPIGWYEYALKGAWGVNSSDKIIFLPL